MRQTKVLRGGDSYDARAVLGRLDGECVVAFRGSGRGVSWSLADAAVVDLPGCFREGKPCQVAAPTFGNYTALAAAIREGLASLGCPHGPVALTGHDQGGALALLAAKDLAESGVNVSKAYTFGQPRIGDAGFGAAFRSSLADVPVFRVTKDDDPIVNMPDIPPFQHAGTEVYYEGSGLTYRICKDDVEDPTCAARQRGKGAEAMLQCAAGLDSNPGSCGHLAYLAPAKEGVFGPFTCEAHADQAP